jgi:hypothetical protein
VNAIAPLVLIVVSAGVVGVLGVRRTAISDGPDIHEVQAELHREARRTRALGFDRSGDVRVRIDARGPR